MNEKVKGIIKEMTMENEEINQLVENYDNLDILRKYNLVAKLSSWLLLEKKMSKAESIKMIDLILQDIKTLDQQKRKRRLYNNYDTYMYTVHHLKYDLIMYLDIIYDLDNSEDRNRLLVELEAKQVIKKTESWFKFTSKDSIQLLKSWFIYHDEDNNHLNDRAIVLNLEEIGMLKKL